MRNCTQDNVVKDKYPNMPMPEKSSGRGYKFVRFKEEKNKITGEKQINIQLGKEKGLEIFNQNIKEINFRKEIIKNGKK